MAGNRSLSRQSLEQIRALVHDGIPESGMPAFDLPPPQLDALAAFVRSLNAPAAESAVAGIAKSGEQFFFGKGECVSCYMGDPGGDFVAVDERDGRRLWHFPTGRDMKASPMTYTIDGKQLVALAAGPNILCFGLP